MTIRGVGGAADKHLLSILHILFPSGSTLQPAVSVPMSVTSLVYVTQAFVFLLRYVTRTARKLVTVDKMRRIARTAERLHQRTFRIISNALQLQLIRFRNVMLRPLF